MSDTIFIDLAEKEGGQGIMLRYYTLEDKTPVPTDDVMVWARFFEKADRHVAKDTIGDFWVSTVFMGIDHSFGFGPPLLFETMVFGGPLDQECVRYSTWDEAEAGHQAMVKRVKDKGERQIPDLPDVLGP